MNIKHSTLAAALTAVFAMGASGQAAADSVYAGSELQLSGLTIVFTDANGTQITGLSPQFTFNVEDSATLNGATTAFAAGCSSLLNNCSAVSPVLKVPVANAPLSVPLRANTDYSLLGPAGSAGDYANSNAEIASAQLVQGVPSATKQVSETELTAPNQQSQASTNIQSNTTFTFEFTLSGLTSPATMFLDFSADPEMQALVDLLSGIGIAQSNMSATFTLNQLTGSGPLALVLWSPNGTAGDAICANVTCSGELDPESLNIGLGEGPINGNSTHSLGNAAGIFALDVSGLTAGNYSLTLAALTSVNATSVAVPEPGTLLLLGGGLAGMGVFGKGRRRQVKAAA
jgi:PEP-CTERM motif-containing protein